MYSFRQSNGTDRVGLVGKVPRRGDFVRQNISGPLSEFEQWLLAAVQELNLAQTDLPPRILRFAMRLPDHDDVLVVGVLAPSQDQVGRRFPVALAAHMPWDAVAPNLLGVPSGLGPWFASLEGLVREIPALGYEEICARLAQLAAPDPALPAGAEPATILAQMAAGPFLARILGSSDAGAHSYAASTYCTAARAYREGGPAAGSGTSVPCPIEQEQDVTAWLALAQALSPSGRGFGSVLWPSDPEAPLLLSFGTTPRQALLFSVDGTLNSNDLWPLHTGVQSAIDAAAAAVGPIIETHVRNRGATVADLWRALSEHYR